MLRTWLGDTPLEVFVRQHLGREPLARPAAAADATGYLGWQTLASLLPHEGLDALVVRSGREQPVLRPRDLPAARRLLEDGLGLVVRRAERHDAGLARLARRFARDLPPGLQGRVHVQLFVTAARTHGFGWHYDAEEVFIVQTAGAKDYYFRRNTFDPDPTPGAQPDFGRVRGETTPVMGCTLEPGDWLYLPRGWWHVAKARADSLSISLGVTHPAPG